MAKQTPRADESLSKSETGQQLVAILGDAGPEVGRASTTPSLAWVEWEYLHSVLVRCHHNRSEAARRLGIHRSVLQRKLARNPPIR